MTSKNKEKWKGKIKIISALITVAVVIIFFYVVINSDALQQEFQSQVQTYGVPSVFVFSFLLDLLPQIISPMVILTAGIIAGIPTKFAIIITILGSALGSMVGFAIGKKYMYGAVQLTASKSGAQKLTHLTNKYGKIIVPIAAISPLPYLPILLGAMNFTKRNLLIYGVLPRTISFIIAGYLIKIIA